VPSKTKSSQRSAEIKPISDAEFNREKEQQKQLMNGLEIAIGEEKIQQKKFSLEGEKIRTEISEIGVKIAAESLTQAGYNLAVAKEKSQQLSDSLKLEIGRTKINTEKCLTEAEKISFELSQAKLMLSESQSHFKLVSGQ